MGSVQQFDSGLTPYRDATHAAPIKDVIGAPSNGFVRFRFRVTNPGYWYFHCHFEWHMHIGMRVIVKFGEKKDMVPPPKGFPTCGHFQPDVCTV